MKIATLQELFSQAQKEGWALPHFNFASLSQLHGIIDALKETHSPAMVGTSEKEREFFGMKEAVGIVRGFREDGIAVYLNADHCLSVESALEACDAEYDSVHIDLSKHPLEENISGTSRVVAYAKQKNPRIHIEGEVGYIATDSSRIYTETISIPKESYAKIPDALRFWQETKVHRLAPAVGTIHGIAANAPAIDFKLIEALRSALGDLPLVMHGGSGVSDADIQEAVKRGITNIHISTELRVAYAHALSQTLEDSPDALAPYAYLQKAREATARIAREKIILMGSAGRA
ncbi:MAG: class II fructose-bisphosphate aldolase [Candidatus Wildermuthbacteria bacterium]|nr:class II fructose-bisphosphate aldolase [Candidatus Wildermuthbacteria bacterium]